MYFVRIGSKLIKCLNFKRFVSILNSDFYTFYIRELFILECWILVIKNNLILIYLYFKNTSMGFEISQFIFLIQAAKLLLISHKINFTWMFISNGIFILLAKHISKKKFSRSHILRDTNFKFFSSLLLIL